MLISFNWLKEFVEINDSPSALAERLTMAGLETESVISLEQGFEKVVIGEILSKESVPDSDHLTLCQVDVGKEKLQIVCGAPNHRAGDKVVVALPGAELPGGIAIRRTKVRGVESNGMICSEKELAISEDASGVIILSEDVTVGAEAAEVLGRKDTILELDLTPNRPDALSHVGIAREVAALTGCSLKIDPPNVQETGPEISSFRDVEINDPELCLRYTGRVITDVTVRQSPLWMQQRLRAVGLRPINNVVDVTNYVLMERGHPLHAFDDELLAGERIVVRRAAAKEKITTLDGVERRLNPSMLVICDHENPVAVAGVMGGESSEVRNETRRIFLEAAYFQPTSIRKTSKVLGLHSESSHRFERGTDIQGLVDALDRAAELICETTGGKVAIGRIDRYPGKCRPKEVSVRPRRVRSLLGTEITSDDVSNIFSRLCLKVLKETPDEIAVSIPCFRVDLNREIDLIEEIARVYGYNRITSTLPQVPLGSGEMTREQSLMTQVRSVMQGLGYQETIHYSFHHPEDMNRIGLSDADPLRRQVRIRNPLSEDQSVLRSTMLPGLMQTLQHNMNRSISDLKIFEVGRVFEPQGSGLPLEKNRAAGLITGQDRPAGWDIPAKELDFFDLKGDLQALLNAMGISDLRFEPLKSLQFLHPGKSASIVSKGVQLGFLGELHPKAAKGYELPGLVYCFELDLDHCFQEASEKMTYRPVPRFPSVERDIAVILSEEIPADEVARRIQSVEPELIRDIRLFDLYRGKPVPSGKKSLAFSMRFQASDRTLTDEEINRIRDSIIDTLAKEFQASLRE